ncbi:MAG: hemoglobin [Chlamydiales bacterium]|jgi:hemoglobin
MSDTKTSTGSLYERIGGKAAIDASVDLFYEKVLADDLLKPFFDGVDMAAQKGKQRTFLALAFGAPVNYTGKDLRSGHAEMVERGLSEEHFNAVAGHLAGTLTELNVDQKLTDEVMTIAASTHDDVLGL